MKKNQSQKIINLRSGEKIILSPTKFHGNKSQAQSNLTEELQKEDNETLQNLLKKNNNRNSIKCAIIYQN